jgi:hypothetical protein
VVGLLLLQHGRRFLLSRKPGVRRGAHGGRGFNRLLLGSNAERVLRGTPVPSLLVREGTKHDRHGIVTRSTGLLPPSQSLPYGCNPVLVPAPTTGEQRGGDLGALDPDAVRVELYASSIDGIEPASTQMTRLPEGDDAAEVCVYSARVPATRPVSHYWPRAVQGFRKGIEFYEGTTYAPPEPIREKE